MTKDLERLDPTVSLPWVDDAFAPNAILRSPIFPAVNTSSQEEMVKNLVIFDRRGVVIEFTGIRFTQYDLDVWLVLIRAARDQAEPNYSEIVIEERRMLRMLKRSEGGSEIKRLKESIKKLTMGFIVIKNDKKGMVYGGHLISEFWYSKETRRWKCSLSRETVRMFLPGEWSRMHFDVRLDLGKSALALWLHGHYCSHKSNGSIPMSIEHIYFLCGSKDKSMKSFKQNLKSSLEKIHQTCAAHDLSFDYRIEGANVFVSHTLSKSTDLIK